MPNGHHSSSPRGDICCLKQSYVYLLEMHDTKFISLVSLHWCYTLEQVKMSVGSCPLDTPKALSALTRNDTYRTLQRFWVHYYSLKMTLSSFYPNPDVQSLDGDGCYQVIQLRSVELMLIIRIFTHFHSGFSRFLPRRFLLSKITGRNRRQDRTGTKDVLLEQRRHGKK